MNADAVSHLVGLAVLNPFFEFLDMMIESANATVEPQESNTPMFSTSRVCTRPSSALALAASIGGLALCPSLGTGPKLPVASVVPTGVSSQAVALKKAAHAFVENRGQWDAQAQFLARAPGMDIWITDSGVVYDFHETRAHQGAGVNARGIGGLKPALPQRKGHVVRMEFVGGTPSSVRGEDLLEGRYNYFLGNDESKWASNVPRYGEARAERVYDGIEARWYFDQGMPRYDLIVAPGADPGKIAMRFEGAQGMAGGKTLKLGTSLGDVEHKGLFVYQNVGGATKQVPASFVVRGNVAKFELGDYDKSKPLVIDPLVYSTFLGGAGPDLPKSVALDSSGGAVVVGITSSAGFPTTIGAYDQSHNGGTDDAFVTKLSADGSSLIFSTFLGGDGIDQAYSVALDSLGAPTVVGITLQSAAGFPTTVGAFDQVHNGGNDAFVTKLAADGSSLLYSTFLGGAGNDGAYAVALDSSGGATVAGYTNSSNFPTLAGSYDQVYNGAFDAFVSRLSADGSSLIYSTYLGGAANMEIATSVALDSSGNAVVAGTTGSSDFPAVAGSYDQTYASEFDGFVTKLSADGSSLLYSTFLGGTGYDEVRSVALDSSGAAIVAGYTASTGFPTTPGSFDTTYSGAYDIFVSRLSAGGSSLLYSTYLGGLLSEIADSVALDSSGAAVVVGYTSSSDYPTTAGAQDVTHNGGPDAIVSRLSADGSTLLYSTFHGGATFDRAFSVALDSTGGAVIAGQTDSTNFPTTVGSYDETYNTFTDGFVTKLPVASVVSAVSVPQNSFVGGFSVPLTINMTVATSLDYIVALSTDTPGKVFVEQTKIKAGKDSKTFGVRTESVKVNTPVMVTATFGGVSKSVSFTLKPGGLLTLKLNPTSISSLESGTGTVTLSAPAPQGGRLVDLESSNAALLYVPVNVGIPQGQLNAVFPTFAGFVAASSNVTVRARLGTMVKTATLTLNP